MKKLRSILSRIRLVYRRSSVLTKCVVLATIVVCTAAVVVLSAATAKELEKQADKRHEAAVLEQENQDLKDRISILGTVESFKQIAGEVLDLVDPNTVIIEAE